jgi:adenylate cyclase
VGKKEAVTVFEPFRKEIYDARKDAIEKFLNGLQFFYKGQFDAALEIFQSLAAVDPPAAKYAAKCLEMEKQTLSDWNGVWVMTSK